jgi:hypothetical protein
MKNYLSAALLMSFIVSGCQKNPELVAPQATPQAPTAANTLGINDLVSEASIGVQIKFIEKKFSLVPSSASDSVSTYEYQGCNLELDKDENGNVLAVTAFITSNKCSLETRFGNSARLTLEKIISDDKRKNLESRILVKCVSSCGRTSEPEYSYLVAGSASNNYISTLITSNNVEGADDWQGKVKEVLKLESLDDDEVINCTNEFDKLAMGLLRKGDISSVQISASNFRFWNEYPIYCKK